MDLYNQMYKKILFKFYNIEYTLSDKILFVYKKKRDNKRTQKPPDGANRCKFFFFIPNTPNINAQHA